MSEITTPEGVRIHLWHVTERMGELEAQCRLAGIDTLAVNLAKAPSRRVELMVEHLLLGQIFGRPVALCHRSTGQPFVEGIAAHLSISHTRGMVGVALCDSRHIGMDIEFLGDRVLRVRPKFLTPGELERIAADDVKANLMAWTAKEAVFKAAYVPGLSGQDDIVTTPVTIASEGAVMDVKCRGQIFSVRFYRPTGFMLAVASLLGRD